MRSTAKSRSSASSSTSSRRPRHSPWCSRGNPRSRSCERRWARRTRRTPPPAPSAATSRWRCPTTSSTARTRRNLRNARSPSGSAMTSSELPSHALRNREVWTQENASYTGPKALEAWQQEEIRWGVLHVPESEVGALPNVAGKDVVELGCGTAYFSAWLARRGARPVGVDVTPAQLESARARQRQLGIEFPLLAASAEDVPLPDASFDLALSEYGASIWCDPERWIAEAARLLRTGGDLVFLVNSAPAILCSPDEGKVAEQLQRPQFGMHRFVWPPDEEINF